MKVLLLNGSPNAGGCTDTALRELEEELRRQGVETELCHVGLEPVRGCTACEGCHRAGDNRCVFDGDAVNRVLEKAAYCDGFVFGAPVYFAGVAGTMKCLLDRVFYAGRPLFCGKPGTVVVSARRAGTTAAYDQLNKYIGISGMLAVPSRYWNMVHGYTAEDTKKDLEGLQIMRDLGKNMAWLLRLLELGKENGLVMPEFEAKTETNFIH